MHIIIFILKILGYVLLALLGIIILLLCLVLFAPVRYRFWADKEETEIHAKIHMHWLFPILYYKGVYEEGKYSNRLYVFGIPILPRKREQSRKEKKKDRKKSTEPSKIRPELEPVKIQSKLEPEKKEDSNSENEKIEPATAEKGYDVTDNVTAKEKLEQTVEHKRIVKDKNVFSKLKEKWIRFFENAKKALQKAIRFIEEIIQKKNLIMEFLKNEDNKKGLLGIWNAVKGLLKHLKPKKIKGQVVFGFEDPSQTGMILGAVSIINPFSMDDFIVEADFDNVCLKGNIFLRGRIQAFTLLRICIKVLLDKNFRELKNNFDELKEEL